MTSTGKLTVQINRSRDQKGIIESAFVFFIFCEGISYTLLLSLPVSFRWRTSTNRLLEVKSVLSFQQFQISTFLMPPQVT